jgi:hypothetical protein
MGHRICGIVHHHRYHFAWRHGGAAGAKGDTNKDGKLSVTECMALYKDKSIAERNCTYWDTDKDGIITEDEYVKQVSSMGKKK